MQTTLSFVEQYTRLLALIKPDDLLIGLDNCSIFTDKDFEDQEKSDIERKKKEGTAGAELSENLPQIFSLIGFVLGQPSSPNQVSHPVV